MWLLFTLIAALFWGIGQVFAKRGLEHTTPLFNNILAGLITLCATIPFALLTGGKFSDFPKLFSLSFLIAILLLSYYYVIAKANISLVGTVLGTYPAFTVILSLMFLHESPSTPQWIAAILIMIGTIILIVGEDLSLAKKLKFGTWVIWGIGGAAAAGIADFLAKIALTTVNGKFSSYLLCYGIVFVLVAFGNTLLDKKGRKFPKITKKKFLPTFIGVAMIELGMVAYYIALSLGFASIVTPVSSVYVALTAVLAWIFLKERANKLQIAGILTACIGIILLGIP